MRSKLHFFFRIIIYHFLLTPISELLKTKFAKLNSGVNLNIYICHYTHFGTFGILFILLMNSYNHNCLK